MHDRAIVIPQFSEKAERVIALRNAAHEDMVLIVHQGFVPRG
jgi:hypothetical protein